MLAIRAYVTRRSIDASRPSVIMFMYVCIHFQNEEESPKCAYIMLTCTLAYICVHVCKHTETLKLYLYTDRDRDRDRDKDTHAHAHTHAHRCRSRMPSAPLSPSLPPSLRRRESHATHHILMYTCIHIYIDMYINICTQRDTRHTIMYTCIQTYLHT
jgi:ABC-type nickel/cobalt efflux system permease component RcnA